jgi:hypothetical protein
VTDTADRLDELWQRITRTALATKPATPEAAVVAGATAAIRVLLAEGLINR